MLALLLDEHISPEVARQILSKRPEIPIISVHHWQAGRYLSVEDDPLIRAAAEAGLSLVTYDQRTIPRILVRLASEEVSHAGVVFVDDNSLPRRDFGKLLRALIRLWEERRDEEWTNRIFFLRPAT